MLHVPGPLFVCITSHALGSTDQMPGIVLALSTFDANLQLIPQQRDKEARRTYADIMGKPKQGNWKLARASWSPAVLVLAEGDPDQKGLNEELSYIGSGATGTVT